MHSGRALAAATWLVAAVAAQRFQLDPTADSRLAAGKAQVEKYASDPSENARSCWASAVEDLKEGCRTMDDAQRSRLAVTFTNCHLVKSGMESYACDASMTIEQCTRPMVDSPSGLAFSSYTTFYTHAESMCYYLQSTAFQQATESAVDALQSSAAGTAERLLRLQAQAGEVLGEVGSIRTEQQEAAEAVLEGQKRAAAELSALQASQAAAFADAEAQLAGLQTKSTAALASLHQQAEELSTKHNSLTSGIDRLLSLQGTLLGEFMDIKSIVFYTCMVILTLSLTSTSATACARLPIFGLLTANMVLEKLIVSWLLASSSHETSHFALWGLRRATCSLALATLIYYALHHTDMGKKTLSAIDELKEMHQTSAEHLADKLAKLEATHASSPLHPPRHPSSPRRASTSPPHWGPSSRERELAKSAVSSSVNRLRRASKSPLVHAVGADGRRATSPASAPGIGRSASREGGNTTTRAATSPHDDEGDAPLRMTPNAFDGIGDSPNPSPEAAEVASALAVPPHFAPNLERTATSLSGAHTSLSALGPAALEAHAAELAKHATPAQRKAHQVQERRASLRDGGASIQGSVAGSMAGSAAEVASVASPARRSKRIAHRVSLGSKAT